MIDTNSLEKIEEDIEAESYPQDEGPKAGRDPFYRAARFARFS
jgi:hypothetical protein